MIERNYDIEFSNGVTVTVLLTDEHPVTLSVKLPSGKIVDFSHDPKAVPPKKERTVTHSFSSKSESKKSGKWKNGSIGPINHITLTDSPSLTMTYGDPEDPNM